VLTLALFCAIFCKRKNDSDFRYPGGILLFLVPGCIPLFTIITSVFATDVDIISDPFSTRVDVVNESLIPSDKPGH
jgi:hypothetical protein